MEKCDRKNCPLQNISMPAKKEHTLIRQYKETISQITRLQKKIMNEMVKIQRNIQEDVVDKY